MKKVFIRTICLLSSTLWIFGIPILWPLMGVNKWLKIMDKLGKPIIE